MLLEINTILYPTDLGLQGPTVLRYVASLARAQGVKIVLLHVLEPLSRHARHVIDQFLHGGVGSTESLRREGVPRLRDQIHERLVRFCEEELASDPRGKGDMPEIRIVEA
ncbi:MAG: hypothetical protein CMM60_13225 [Rhodospirillaceae bacterium]|jgi:hypothetical protein|nr:hypothetical protein [Rhodospirillaceae bacterium]|tara:strand:+ start:11709 stop:12038 length:330 start_codon:yes stop_codon:yes gene_type:complete